VNTRSVPGGPNSYPWFAFLFATLFGLGAWLLRAGGAVAGALVIGVLAAFEVVDYPQWAKHGALDRLFDTAIAVVALAGVGVAIAVLVTRRSTRSRDSVTTRE
jgi:hypothetical protein